MHPQAQDRERKTWRHKSKKWVADLIREWLIFSYFEVILQEKAFLADKKVQPLVLLPFQRLRTCFVEWYLGNEGPKQQRGE